jgi:hypothetical protein
MTNLTTEQTEDIEIRVNNQLVRFDNLLTALDYLQEEIKTRKPDPDEILNSVKEVLEGYNFFNRITRWISQHKLPDVIFDIKSEINQNLNSYIDLKITQKLDEQKRIIERKLNEIEANQRSTTIFDGPPF